MQFVGIDVGRDRVKAVTAGRAMSFKSKVGEWRERRLTSDGDYEVDVDGQKFFVADLAEESYFRREMVTESKVHQETQILFLTGLALVATPGERTMITTGLPVTQHTPDGKEALTGLLQGLHTMSVNGQRGTFVIERLGIVPEAGGAYWDAVLGPDGRPNNTWLASQRVRVVDIGSRTVNYCTVDQRRYLDRDSGTLPYGVLELYNAETELGDIACEQFARRIVADINKRWLEYQPRRDAVLLTGGGALLLEKWLRPHFPLMQMADKPVFGNARGYWKMGVARWGAR